MSQTTVNCPMCGTPNVEPRCRNCGELFDFKPECVLCLTKAVDFTTLPVLRADCPDCNGTGWVLSYRDGQAIQIRCACCSTLVVCDPCKNKLPLPRSKGNQPLDHAGTVQVGCIVGLVLLSMPLLAGLFLVLGGWTMFIGPLFMAAVYFLIVRLSAAKEPAANLQAWQWSSQVFRELARLLHEQRLLLYGDHPEEQANADRLNQVARQLTQPIFPE